MRREDGSDPELTPLPPSHFARAHARLGATRAPPCRYVALVKTYHTISTDKKSTLLKRKETLEKGVSALVKARATVSSLRASAGAQRRALASKRAAAARALDLIAGTVAAASATARDVATLKTGKERESGQLQIERAEIEKELASVEPLIARARAGVGDIDAAALSEVRSLRAPPDVVRDVLEGVLRLMGISDTSWHSMKSFLSKRSFKEDIRSMDASQISGDSLAAVQKLLARRGASFEERAARRASAACAPLAAWVLANVAYASALEKVRPLLEKQRDLEKNLSEAEAQLSTLSGDLKSVDERVASLKEELNRYTKEGLEIEMKLAAADESIARAESLVDKLSGECESWERDLSSISTEIEEISVRSLLAAATLVYLTNTPEDVARNLIEELSGELNFDASNFSVVNFLASLEDQLKWHAAGLPADSAAVRNAVVVDQAISHQFSFSVLIIDPDGEAMPWLRAYLAEIGGDCMPHHSEKLPAALNHAMRTGRTLLIEQTTHIEDAWLSALRKSAPAHPKFRLALHSRDASLPERAAYRAALLSPLDLAHELPSLREQLMSRALGHARPGMHEEVRALREQKARLQKQKHELQEQLLRDLCSNTDILQDAALLRSLTETRATTLTITEALAHAKQLEDKTREMYSKYRDSAEVAAELLLAVRQMSAVYKLVSVSVDTITDVYIEGLQLYKDGEGTLEEMRSHLLSRVCERVALSLHARSRPALSLHLARVARHPSYPPQLWELFIGSVVNVDEAAVRSVKSELPWLPPENAALVANLKSTAPELYSRLRLDDSALWRAFLASGNLDALAALRLTALERVVCARALRPESVPAAVAGLALESGLAYQSWGGIEAGCAWAGRGGAASPVLLIGAHAADQLHAHALQRKIKLVQMWVSGTDDGWCREWDRVVQQGGDKWVALELGGAPFSPTLHTLLTTFSTQYQKSDLGPDFRVWVVCEDREIPPLIARSCVSVVLEAPEGIRSNVTQTISAWRSFESNDVRLTRTVFCLTLLHAVVQERRNYTPRGWTQPYEWEWGDLNGVRSAAAAGGGGISLTAGITHALYAGRISNDADLSILEALVQEYLSEKSLAPSFKPRGVNVQLPMTKNLQGYEACVGGWPGRDAPASLALPENARGAHDLEAGARLLSDLRELNVTARVSEKKEQSNSVKPLLALWKKLMSGSAFLKRGHDFWTVRGSDGSGDARAADEWWSCAAQCECRQVGGAARAVHATLAAAARARAGADTARLAHQTCEEWQSVWAGPEVSARYVRELAHRAAAAEARVRDLHLPPPKEVDMRSWTNARRVVAALRARTQRSGGRAAHHLELRSQWDCPDTTDELSHILVGLNLEGGVWRAGAGGGGVAPAARDTPLKVPAPPIRIYFSEKSSDATPAGAWCAVPVFASPDRSRRVCTLRAPLAGLGAREAALSALALVVADVA